MPEPRIRRATATELIVAAVAGAPAWRQTLAAVCAATLDAGAPDYQLLFFPVTDLSSKHRSYELFGDGYFLTAKQMDWYRGHYLAADGDALDPLASPLLGDVAGHPPAHVAVSGFDVLRDDLKGLTLPQGKAAKIVADAAGQVAHTAQHVQNEANKMAKEDEK